MPDSLEAAPAGLGGGGLGVVDPHHAGPDGPGGAEGLAHVPGPDGGGQAVLGVVGQPVTSSMSSKGRTVATGPKISSRAMRQVLELGLEDGRGHEVAAGQRRVRRALAGVGQSVAPSAFPLSM